MKHIAALAAAAALSSFSSSPHAENLTEAERIKAEAMSAHPSDPLAATKASNEALERRALGERSGSPRENAALVFLGYYAKNVYAIPEVCREQAVDLTEFSKAFVEANKAPFEASAAMVDTNVFIERARTSAKKNAKSELERFASVQRTDIRGACSFVRTNAREMANGAKFANIMPKVYELLVSR